MASDLDALAALSLRARRIPFVTLVEHLERVLGGAPVGTALAVSDEIIRFRHDANLIFHTSDVAAMTVLDARRVEVTSTFLGAIGSVSPLASFFTEELLRTDATDSASLGAFYDLFHHRLLALCYRALQRNRPAWSIRRSADDDFTRRALAITGLAERRPDAPLASTKLLGRARVVGQRPRSRAALEAALQLAFPALRVQIVDFFPQRVRLQLEQRLRLGKKNHRLGAETRLGRNMVAQSDVVRLCIGPVERSTYDHLLPGGHEHMRLRRLVDRMTGGMVDIELDIELAHGHEPHATLGERGGRAGARLGHGALVRTAGTAKTVHARLVLGEDAGPLFFQTP